MSEVNGNIQRIGKALREIIENACVYFLHKQRQRLFGGGGDLMFKRSYLLLSPLTGFLIPVLCSLISVFCSGAQTCQRELYSPCVNSDIIIFFTEFFLRKNTFQPNQETTCFHSTYRHTMPVCISVLYGTDVYIEYLVTSLKS